MGVYLYDLKLIATPAPPERTMHFKVGLGGSHTQVFRFMSFSKTKTEYGCKIESTDFTVEKTVTAMPGNFLFFSKKIIYKINIDSWTQWY